MAACLQVWPPQRARESDKRSSVNFDHGSNKRYSVNLVVEAAGRPSPRPPTERPLLSHRPTLGGLAAGRGFTAGWQQRENRRRGSGRHVGAGWRRGVGSPLAGNNAKTAVAAPVVSAGSDACAGLEELRIAVAPAPAARRSTARTRSRDPVAPPWVQQRGWSGRRRQQVRAPPGALDLGNASEAEGLAQACATVYQLKLHVW